jgi:hypothetical protein
MSGKLRDSLRRLLSDDAGQGMVEYIIIVLVVAILGIVAWRFLGKKTSAKVSKVAISVDNL